MGLFARAKHQIKVKLMNKEEKFKTLLTLLGTVGINLMYIQAQTLWRYKTATPRANSKN